MKKFFILFWAAVGWASGIYSTIALWDYRDELSITYEYLAFGVLVFIFMGAIGWTKEYIVTKFPSDNSSDGGLQDDGTAAACSAGAGAI